MKFSSFESSHWDASNGSSFIDLASIERESALIKVLESFGVSKLYIDTEGMNLSPFDASQRDESNELNLSSYDH